ncbi:1-acyl-sn-glycerol-3-phosphate acyltransferase [Aquihabitans sp. McL0605]|uniref:1-acyl-sn-glycerol-3-phosphate acyltransferase n=1 Tax=Aquihabitans sp. McL0605 TaxID=3415671 RepID=UPI003CE7AA21
MRSAFDRFVSLVARLITRGLYRSVEVVGLDHLPKGPRLIVANHFNGFVDPVVIAGAMGELPRFIAKATLWKTPGVPLLMRLVGVLPVHRSADGGGDNSRTFDDVVAELHHGMTVAIFPEGTTHDNQHLSPVRTGAARLALDAAESGVEGMHVVPVGVTFEDKVALRSRVVIRAGTPIDPAGPAYRDVDGTPLGSEHHEAVRALTDEIRAGLAAAAPDFDTLLDAVEMRRAADVALRAHPLPPLAEVSLAKREALAKQLDHLPTEERDPIATAAAEYELLLGAVRISDRYLAPKVGVRDLVVRLITTGVLVALLAPFAVVGVAVNLIPTLLVVLAGLAASAPVSKGTNRVLVGFIAFPATWIALSVFDVGSGWVSDALALFTSPLSPEIDWLFGSRGGWGASLLVFIACPALGLLAVWLAERVIRVYATWRAVSTNLNRRGQLGDLLERRGRLVEMVHDARAWPGT